MPPTQSLNNISVYKNGTQKVYDITDEKRAWYRKISQESRLSKLSIEEGLIDSMLIACSSQIDIQAKIDVPRSPFKVQ